MKYKKGSLNFWGITHLPVHECLNYATAPPATQKGKGQRCTVVPKIKLKLQNSMEIWIYIREQWYDQKKTQGNFSIWTKEAQCSIICLYPKTRLFQVLPEKRHRHSIEKWELDTYCAKDTETNPHTATYRKRIEQSYALGIWQHDQVPSKAQVVQQLWEI
jgi:hypothetical protein